jgi:hypothetical protein
VWEKIPNELINSEEVDEWQQLTKNCQRFLTGKKLKKSRKNKRQHVFIDNVNAKLDGKIGVYSK